MMAQVHLTLRSLRNMCSPCRTLTSLASQRSRRKFPSQLDKANQKRGRTMCHERSPVYPDTSEFWQYDSLDKASALRGQVLQEYEKARQRQFAVVSVDAHRVRECTVATGWNPRMALYCGQKGVTLHLDDSNGTALILFADGQTWWLGQDALTFSLH
eukprot:TRINITY_DN28483_c0_g2_i1.p1 TRINITY_DN28483_c0_g2~~TRINITY_DN28483_c0_g2_i1.p1  ORF type:complete len:175 (-),score=10.67 TRINITY_DN28483_c0_g2_i1:102-572(-)